MSRRKHKREDPFVRYQKPAAAAVTALLFPLIILASIPDPAIWVRLLEGLIETLVVVAVVLSVASTPLRRRVLATSAIATLAISWVRLAYPHSLSETADAVQTVFFSLVIFELISDIFGKKSDRTGRLLSALNLYVLAAAAFARIYGLVEEVFPNSFRVADGSHLDASMFLYYSFTTQTTLGYGDIIPVLPLARAFAVVQATLGVLYLAVIVAAIVGDRFGGSHT